MSSITVTNLETQPTTTEDNIVDSVVDDDDIESVNSDTNGDVDGDTDGVTNDVGDNVNDVGDNGSVSVGYIAPCDLPYYDPTDNYVHVLDTRPSHYDNINAVLWSFNAVTSTFIASDFNPVGSMTVGIMGAITGYLVYNTLPSPVSRKYMMAGLIGAGLNGCFSVACKYLTKN